MTDAEDAGVAWIALQQTEHGPSRTISPQYGGLFHLPVKRQGCSNNVSSLACPHQGATEEMVQRLQHGAQRPRHQGLCLTALLG
jgi:hypothetical protein